MAVIQIPIQAFADVMSCVMEAIDARLGGGEEVEVDLGQSTGEFIRAWLKRHPEPAVSAYMLTEIERWQNG